MFGSVPAPDQSGGGGDGDEGYGDLGELLGAMERVDAPGGAPHTIQRSRNSDLALRATSMTQSALRNIIYFCIPATRPV